MEHELQKLGFSEYEAKVYLALIELERGTVSQIARKAGINRTTVYDVIRHLWEWELVSEVAGMKKQTFVAASPSKLPVVMQQRANIAAHRVDQARELVGQLKLLQQSTGFRPQIVLFEGMDGIKRLYNLSLESKGPIRAFLSAESLEGFEADFARQYFRKRAAKKIHIRAIMADDLIARQYQRQDKALLRETRIVPHDKMDVQPETYIYDDNIALFSLREKVGVLITSPDMAKAQRKLFDLAWEKAGEYMAPIVRKG